MVLRDVCKPAFQELWVLAVWPTELVPGSQYVMVIRHFATSVLTILPLLSSIILPLTCRFLLFPECFLIPSALCYRNWQPMAWSGALFGGEKLAG